MTHGHEATSRNTTSITTKTTTTTDTMTSVTVAVYKTIKVYTKRAKIEIFSETPTDTPTDTPTHARAASPCRILTHRTEDNEELGFRTAIEMEELMELEDNFAQEDYSKNILEMLPKCSVPSLVKMLPKCSVPLIVKILPKCSVPSLVAPEPPVSLELSLFDAKIMKLSTFQNPRKRRFNMGICDDSCHWCVNNV